MWCCTTVRFGGSRYALPCQLVRERVSTPANPVGRSILELVIRPRSEAEAAFTALGLESYSPLRRAPIREHDRAARKKR